MGIYQNSSDKRQYLSKGRRSIIMRKLCKSIRGVAQPGQRARFGSVRSAVQIRPPRQNTTIPFPCWMVFSLPAHRFGSVRGCKLLSFAVQIRLARQNTTNGRTVCRKWVSVSLEVLNFGDSGGNGFNRRYFGLVFALYNNRKLSEL